VILVDTNVVIDVATLDPVWFEWSGTQIANATATDGRVVINEIVYAELSVRYADRNALDTALEGCGLSLVRTPRAALFLAGKTFVRYRRAGGVRTGMLPDFFIGAHAVIAGVPLITRDMQRLHAYFPDIELISPDRN